MTMPDRPAGLAPRNTVRGRPRTAGGFVCSRCGRSAGKHRARWPEGRICGTCFTAAMNTRGRCPGCGADRLLPGPPDQAGGPRCGSCAGIDKDFRCTRCRVEGENYRSGICARCALRDDLTALLITPADRAQRAPLAELVDTLCSSGRPASILTWKQSPKVSALLTQLSTGEIPVTHQGLDQLPPGLSVEHLRALLVHSGALPHRDPYLARFEQWIESKLAPLPPEIAQPVERFATWHHLRRIRTMTGGQRSLRGPVHSAKQEITETVKFLTWLHTTHQRTAATCTQFDVDTWLATGPTTRSAIRTFFIFAKTLNINRAVEVTHRAAARTPTITQQQRIAWIRELMTGNSESLPYRVAGILLLLLAQPLVKIAELRIDDILLSPTAFRIRLGKDPTPIPEPFAVLIREHAKHRPNLATGNGPSSPWLFPGYRAGTHLHPDTIMIRLRELGISLLGARNRALAELVTEVPPSLVADALGYSRQVAFRHAQAAGDPWARYVGNRKAL